MLAQQPDAVRFLSSHRPEAGGTPLPYTSSPLLLVWEDAKLFFQLCRGIPGCVLPLLPFRSAELDELYPSLPNIADLTLHAILVLAQLFFLLSLAVLLFSPVPFGAGVLYFVIFLVVNQAICWLLNRNITILKSKTDVDRASKFTDERWVFLNGVSVGKHWLQSNIDLLSLTFGRQVTGVHNPTAGVIFDIIQCLIQRCFCYATQDVRDAYAQVKDSLLDPRYKKVIFIIHSQGGIEGGMIVDWLLEEIPLDIFAQLEIYSFGNAANHFNNPHKHSKPGSKTYGRSDRVIGHIEHYANSWDFVAQWGVRHFANVQNRYRGNIFVRDGSGHMLNQHYLDNMFPRGPDGLVLEHNEWADREVDLTGNPAAPGDVPVDQMVNYWLGEAGNGMDAVLNASSAVSPVDMSGWPVNRRLRVRDLSRLWAYRNGGSPAS